MDASIQRIDERARLLRGAVQQAGERKRRPGEQSFDFGEELRRRGAGDSSEHARAPDPQSAIAGPESSAVLFASSASDGEREAGTNLDVIV